MKQNIGYRLGKHVRHGMGWFSAEEHALQQRGVPHWLTKVPRYLLIAVAAGLLLVGAFYLFLFLMILAFIAWYLSVAAGSSVEPDSGESDLEGYASGPEGPGMYSQGERISYKDYDDY
ncbi:DUF3742 family protein [Salmonella enterica]|nr:DUF3742 family protein [Salmonella enterica]EAX6601621.1 DUF3742 family protein [Salmonella enterica]